MFLLGRSHITEYMSTLMLKYKGHFILVFKFTNFLLNSLQHAGITSLTILLSFSSGLIIAPFQGSHFEFNKVIYS